MKQWSPQSKSGSFIQEEIVPIRKRQPELVKPSVSDLNGFLCPTSDFTLRTVADISWSPLQKQPVILDTQLETS